MTRTTYLILLLTCFAASHIAFAEDGFVYLKPSTFDQSTKLTVAGKSRTYFVIERDAQVSAIVEGPSQLKVMSRLELPNPTAQPDYTLEVQIEGSKRPRTIHHTSKISEKAESGASFVGVLRSKVIDIPAGKHNVIIKLPEGSSDKVYIRLSLKTNEFTGGTAVVAMTPFEYTSEVELVSDEVIYPYYRIGSNDRAVLKLVGPATLKVLSRIEFSPEMKGSQKWKVQVLEDGRVKKNYSMTAGSSDVIQYKSPSPFLPSRAETFFVEIPDGEHIYEFRMVDDRRTSILRFLLPKTELEGEPR